MIFDGDKKDFSGERLAFLVNDIGTIKWVLICIERGRNKRI